MCVVWCAPSSLCHTPACSGDLRLVEKPTPTVLGPHGFENIKATIKISSTENGIIFGNIGKLGGLPNWRPVSCVGSSVCRAVLSSVNSFIQFCWQSQSKKAFGCSVQSSSNSIPVHSVISPARVLCILFYLNFTSHKLFCGQFPFVGSDGCHNVTTLVEMCTQ